MSDPLGEQAAMGGMLPNGAFGEDPAAPSSGEGDDPRTTDLLREGEPDVDPEQREPGQD